MDLAQQRLGTLIDRACTKRGASELDASLLSSIKALCKQSDDNVLAAFDCAWDKLRAPHAQARRRRHVRRGVRVCGGGAHDPARPPVHNAGPPVGAAAGGAAVCAQQSLPAGAVRAAEPGACGDAPAWSAQG